MLPLDYRGAPGRRSTLKQTTMINDENEHDNKATSIALLENASQSESFLRHYHPSVSISNTILKEHNTILKLRFNDW